MMVSNWIRLNYSEVSIVCEAADPPLTLSRLICDVWGSYLCIWSNMRAGVISEVSDRMFPLKCDWLNWVNGLISAQIGNYLACPSVSSQELFGFSLCHWIRARHCFHLINWFERVVFVPIRFTSVSVPELALEETMFTVCPLKNTFKDFCFCLFFHRFKTFYAL